MKTIIATLWVGFTAWTLVSGAEPKQSPPPWPPPAKGPVDFARDIRPLFADRCYSCHGVEKQKGGLRLDRKQDALTGGDSGKVILPGQSKESLLIQNVVGVDPDNLMPPKGDRLTTNQIALLRAWIDAGAEWPEEANPATAGKPRSSHWAFLAPRRGALPEVQNQSWVRNPIDSFILARLEREKIQPSPEADRATLMRRLSLDLLGLPPPPEAVAKFVNNARSDAYEQLVDRLLASPHYGERWARHWLDLAHYADSDGYEKDTIRPYAYLYRDWVIRAINGDLPFDQFTLEQIAGDLLPGATLEQKTATGFQRQTLTNKEGGVDQEEYRCKATVDRVSTTGAVWLGLTVGCAECHTHKYDPITHREFYQLYAFFNNASEKDLPAPQPDELAAFEKEKSQWDKENVTLKNAVDAYIRSELSAEQAKWEQAFKPSTLWTVLQPLKMTSSAGTTLQLQKDHSVQALGKVPETDHYRLEAEAHLTGITGFRLEILDDPAPGKGPGRGKNNNFVLSEFVVKVPDVSGGAPRLIQLQNAAADYAQKDYPIAAAIDGDAKTGWAVAQQYDRNHVAIFEVQSAFDLANGSKLVIELNQQHGKEHTIGAFRIAVTTSPRPLKLDLTPDAIVGILAQRAEQRSAAERDKLAAFYREKIDPQFRTLNEKVQAHAKKEPKVPPTKLAILAENEKPRETRVHIRGDFLRKGDTVQPATLAVLHPFKPRGEKPDRLDLARWLMDPANPLTARVTVNRFWRHLFGRALTTSEADFGTRGEKPSHPELLDWLATEFTRRGWSQKAMIKLIVTSAAYRQSSVIRPDLRDRDPSNILLARQNRFRIEAENVRDVYLAASGLLNSSIGGPSIRPPLPADIAAIGYANSVKWKASESNEKYRRGLYIFFQRTVPYPMLVTFDAPDSNATCTRRERSNTPLQALTLLNDPVFFECAQALGKRIAADSSLNVNERIRRAFKLCLSREPTPEEEARLQEFHEGHWRLTQSNPENAARIAGASKADANNLMDVATMVAVSRTIMNLDEFVTRE